MADYATQQRPDSSEELEGDSPEIEDQDANREEENRRAQILDTLGAAIALTRKEYIDARQNSGIEQEWLEDEEHYEGIDDANRGEMAAWRSKPMGTPVIQDDDDSITGSTIFFNITAPFVDAGSARVSDMLQPADDSKGWAIGPTPIAEFADLAKGDIPDHLAEQIENDERLAGDVDAIEKTKLELIESSAKSVTAYTDAAKAAETRIEDWHVECQYNAHVRQIVEDASKCGAGVLKGPIPQFKRKLAWIDSDIKIQNQMEPISRRVDFWNLYPDPGCGQNIHDGSGIFERDDITRKVVQSLRFDDTYIKSQLDAVLLEGPYEAVSQITQGSSKPREEMLQGLTICKNLHLFEIWYYYGMVQKTELEAAGCDCSDMDDEWISAHLTMINNRVIKAQMNLLDTGEFPYDIFVWKRRAGMPWGTGISRQMRAPQRVVNGAGRHMMDNAGAAGGPQVVYLEGVVEPQEGDDYEITPWKFWKVAADAGVDFKDLDKVFQFVVPPMLQVELQAIMTLGMELAEKVTGMPMLLQGQAPRQQETLGATQIRNNNGSTVLRRIARLFDDLLTEPHIRRYYTFLLQYGPDDKEKGDFSIDATASSTLMQRDMQDEGIAQMGQFVINPIFGKDPKKWMNEWMRSQNLNPSLMDYDDEEWEGIIEQMAQGDQDPRLAVAQLKVDMDGKLAQMDQAFKQAEGDKDRAMGVAFKELDAQLAKLGMIGGDKMNTDRIKASLAETMATLKAQLRMNDGDVATPLAEPEGRAPDGEAFEK